MQKNLPQKMCVIQIQQDDNMGHGQKQFIDFLWVRQVYASSLSQVVYKSPLLRSIIVRCFDFPIECENQDALVAVSHWVLGVA